MGMVIPITRLSASESVTVTRETTAVVAALLADVGAPAVTAAVVDRAEALAGAAAPLFAAEVAPLADRQAVERAADAVAAGIYKVVTGTTQLYAQTAVPLAPPQQAVANAAALVQSALFADGTSFLVARWSEQFGATEILLRRAADDSVRAAIATLGLTPAFELFAEIHRIYGARMGFTRVLPSVEPDTMTRWYQALEDYIVTVMANHGRDTDLRARLLAPYERASEAVRLARRKATAAEAPAPPATPTPAP